MGNTIIRNKEGKYIAGTKGNPGGKVAGLFSAQALKQIASEYLENHSIAQIINLRNDKKKFGDLTVAHGLVITRMAAAIEMDGRLDFETLMDRVIGKVPNMVNLGGQPDNPVRTHSAIAGSTAEEAYRAMLDG
jgi:hypothetical protein